MNIHSSIAMNSSQVDTACPPSATSVFYDLCLGIVALQGAVFSERLDICREGNFQVRSGVKRLIELRSDLPGYIELRDASLKLLKEALGVEHSAYRALLGTFDSLPEPAVGVEEVDPFL